MHGAFATIYLDIKNFNAPARHEMPYMVQWHSKSAQCGTCSWWGTNLDVSSISRLIVPITPSFAPFLYRGCTNETSLWERGRCVKSYDRLSWALVHLCKYDFWCLHTWKKVHCSLRSSKALFPVSSGDLLGCTLWCIWHTKHQTFVCGFMYAHHFWSLMTHLHTDSCDI